MGRPFDAYLEQLGAFGRYQRLRFYLICVPAVLVSTFCMFVPVFWVQPVSHQCVFPLIVDQTYNDSLVNYYYNPYNVTVAGPDLVEQCKMYNPQCDIFDASCRNDLDSLATNDSWEKVDCQFGHKYFGEKYNVVEKFNLVCGSSYVIGLIFSLMAVGQTVSSVFGTFLTDNIGRKYTFFLSLTWYIICNTIIIFMPNWPSFCTVIFLRSLAGALNFQVIWVYALELVPSTKHALVTFWMMVIWAIFAVALAGIAWLSNTWIQLLCASTFPALVFYGAFPFMDESPRWLLATHRYDQLKVVLEKIAKANGIKLDVNELHTLIDEEAEIVKNSAIAREDKEKAGKIKGIWSLFATRDLTLKTLCMTFVWAVDGLVYEGMMIMVGDIGNNHYVTFALLAAVEVVSDATIYFIADRIGRISPMAFSTALGGLVCLAVVLVPREMHAVTVALAVIAKYFNTLSFDFLFLVGGEIFPTVLRGSGISFCSTVSSLAYIPVPFIVVASRQIPYVPMSIFGALSVAAGIVASFLPETAHQHMIDQVSQTKEQPVGLVAFKKNVTFRSVRKPKLTEQISSV